MSGTVSLIAMGSVAMVAIACLFFLFVALAPELSEKWASEFGGTTRSSERVSKSD